MTAKGKDMKTNQHDFYNAVCDELTQRGIDYRKPDVFGFVAGCWPTDSTAEEVADDFVSGLSKGTEHLEAFRAVTAHNAYAASLSRIESLARNDVADAAQIVKEILREVDSTNDYLLAITSATSVGELEELAARKALS